MSILNALSVFAAGAGRGYRAREETNRQVAEIKRKALLEERDQQIREAAQRTQQQLAQQQILESQTNVEGKKVDTQSKKDQLAREAKSFTGDAGLGDLRSKLGIEDLNYGDVAGLSPLLGDMLREQGRQADINARVNHPYIFGGSRKPYLSAEGEAAQEYLLKRIAAEKPDDLYLSDPNSDVSKAWAKRQDQLFHQYAPEELLDLYEPIPVPFVNNAENRSRRRAGILMDSGKQKKRPSTKGR